MLALAGCGKKGPPLTPFVLLPAAPAQVAVRRVGDQAHVTLTIPVQNIDASKPADVRRIDVYAFTATTMPSRARALELASVVATIPVAAGLPEGALSGQKPRTEIVKGAAAQGATVAITEPLTPDDFIPRSLPVPPGRTAAPGRAAGPGAAAAVVRSEPPGQLRRFYIAVAFSDRGRAGPQSVPAELPLTPVPPAPEALQVVYTAGAVELTWEPAGGLLGFLLDRALPLETLPSDEEAPPRPAAATAATATDVPILPAGPTRYNVYRDLAPDPLVLPPATVTRPPGTIVVGRPLTMEPIEALAFTDAVEFDRARCYVVRAVRGTGAGAVEGAASERRCVTPVDVFAPAPPTSLSTVTGEGSISLIWDPSADDDVAGYLVLRGAPTDATLQPLTAVPVVETQFTDTAVMPGARYVYAVVAVDSRVPLPNVSEESVRVEETAR